MLTMNRATVLGYAGRNPEMRRASSGDEVALFSLATNERFRRRDGTEGETTDWHAVVAFGTAAETVRKRVRKGDPVLVEGRISTRVWTDRTGAEHRTAEIVVSGPRGQINVLKRGRQNGNGSSRDDDPSGGATAGHPNGKAGDAAEAESVEAVAAAGTADADTSRGAGRRGSAKSRKAGGGKKRGADAAPERDGADTAPGDDKAARAGNDD